MYVLLKTQTLECISMRKLKENFYVNSSFKQRLITGELFLKFPISLYDHTLIH